jgi:phosphoserine phosphatase
MAPNLSPKERAMQVWREADAVCFDVDSTVIQDEGLDQIAEHCGVGDKVKEMTNNAMGGKLSFRKALSDRLQLIKPTRQQIDAIVSKPGLIRLTPGMRETVRQLQRRGTEVFLVSGGFHELIDPVAKMLNIPVSNVYANRLLYFYDGRHAGFDHTCPTSESGGKPRVINHIKERFGFEKVVMVGDGQTDMECQAPNGPADAFIGFGGNVVRPKVEQNADWFVRDFQELIREIRPKIDIGQRNRSDSESIGSGRILQTLA